MKTKERQFLKLKPLLNRYGIISHKKTDNHYVFNAHHFFLSKQPKSFHLKSVYSKRRFLLRNIIVFNTGYLQEI